MTNLLLAKEALRSNTTMRNALINAIVSFEKDAGYPHVNVRDQISGPICDELFSGEKFEKRLSSGLVIRFEYNSKIAREFLLSNPAEPDHVWEPMTTRLLNHFAKGAQNVIIAGAYFGDQAILIADNIRNTGICHTFEPNKRNSALIQENARRNVLTNIVINNLALWNKSNERLVFEGEDALASTVTAPQELRGDALHTITIDDYASQAKIDRLDVLMIDVEGNEIKVLQGAERILRRDKPIVVFETHSLYNDWSNGLEGSDSVKLMYELGYTLFAIRDFHQNIESASLQIELLPLNRTYCDTPPHHGFNLLAVPNQDYVSNSMFCIVYDLSPKLILHKQDERFLPSKMQSARP